MDLHNILVVIGWLELACLLVAPSCHVVALAKVEAGSCLAKVESSRVSKHGRDDGRAEHLD